MRFALMPHAGSWSENHVLTMAERYQHGALIVRGRGPAADQAPGAAEDLVGEGLAIEGHGVVLTALRRRGDWLELRLVAETASATEAVVHGPFDEARDADLLGRPLGAIETGPGTVRVPLEPWEIRTVQLRSRTDTSRP